MNFLKRQNGSALILLMIVVCIIALLFFYSSSEQKGRKSPVQVIDTYQEANDDLDSIRDTLDEQNILIQAEVDNASNVQ